jgi:hypothetical protein
MKSYQGSAIIELLLGVSILGLLAVMLTGAIIYIQQSAQATISRNKALLLAEEGLEIARSIKGNNYANLTDGPHGATDSAGRWVFSGTENTIDQFKRVITVKNAGGGSLTVKAGQTVSNEVIASLASGTTANPVYFQTIGTPDGTSAYFDPEQCQPTCSVTMTITTSTSTPVGSYQITVIATAKGADTQTSSFTLVVN